MIQNLDRRSISSCTVELVPVLEQIVFEPGCISTSCLSAAVKPRPSAAVMRILSSVMNLSSSCAYLIQSDPNPQSRNHASPDVVHSRRVPAGGARLRPWRQRARGARSRALAAFSVGHRVRCDHRVQRREYHQTTQHHVHGPQVRTDCRLSRAPYTCVTISQAVLAAPDAAVPLPRHLLSEAATSDSDRGRHPVPGAISACMTSRPLYVPERTSLHVHHEHRGGQPSAAFGEAYRVAKQLM